MVSSAQHDLRHTVSVSSPLVENAILLYKMVSPTRCDRLHMLHARSCCTEQNGILCTQRIATIPCADGVAPFGVVSYALGTAAPERVKGRH